MEIEPRLVEPLISCPASTYGDLFQPHLLEQYKLYVQSVQQVSDRREKANNYFFAINSSLIALYAVASAAFGNQLWYGVLPVVGCLVSLTWYSLVSSYKNLNTSKFRIIHELERHLPAALFRSEWEVCGYGAGTKYRPLTHIERIIPMLFGFLYLLLLAYTIWGPAAPVPKP
ncbi:MAG TPA: hypothetical protein VGQ49_05510 [Bryobacteraceae bacterium]|jgi:hypothetical protein|nr:hypothetical protein [Bryobacteraceae bacterium]